MPRKKKEEVSKKLEDEVLINQSMGEAIESIEKATNRFNILEHSHNELMETVFNLEDTIAKKLLLVGGNTNSDTSNIFQRMIAVMKEVEYIQKGDKKVNNQYTYVSHDQVTGRLHKPCAENGIVVISTMDSHEIQNTMTVCTVTTKFVNSDNPEDHTSVTSVGYGIDRGDKGAGKAMSYAIKYNLLKAFMLETGDDPDHDQSVIRDTTSKQSTPKQSKDSVPKNNKLEVIKEYLQGFTPREKLMEEKNRLVTKIFDEQSDIPNSASTDEAKEHIDRLNAKLVNDWPVAVVDKIYKFIVKE